MQCPIFAEHMPHKLQKSTSDDSHLAGDSKQSENKDFAGIAAEMTEGTSDDTHLAADSERQEMSLLDESGRAYCLNCMERLVPLERALIARSYGWCRLCLTRFKSGEEKLPEVGNTCTRCRNGVIPIRGPPQFQHICRACWKADGYRNNDGTVPDRCSHYGCEGFLKAGGASRRNRLCEEHFRTARAQTWKDFFVDLDIVEDYDPYSLYIGNIPHQWRKPDLIAWISQVRPPRAEDAPPTVRCRKGGYLSDFNAQKECFINFAFVSFDLIQDTWALLVTIYGTYFPSVCGEERRVVAHPAVKEGPPGRWRDLPRPRERDWRVITGEVSDPMGSFDPRLSLSAQGLCAHTTRITMPTTQQ